MQNKNNIASTQEEINSLLELWAIAQKGERKFEYWYFYNILNAAKSWRLWEHCKNVAEQYKPEIDFLDSVYKEICENSCDRAEDFTNTSRENGLYIVQLNETKTIAEFFQEPQLFSSSGWSSLYHHWQGRAGFSAYPIRETEITQVIQQISLNDLVVASNANPTLGEQALMVALDRNDKKALNQLLQDN